MGTLSSIVAVNEHTGGIGLNNDLACKLPRPNPDMKRFVGFTAGHPTIMGRKTWDSIPLRFRPLDRDRTGIVISRTLELDLPNTFVARSFEEALEIAERSPGSDEIFVAGGATIYALAMSFVDCIYKTLIDMRAEADTFFPEHPDIANVIDSYVVPNFEPRLTFQTIVR